MQNPIALSERASKMKLFRIFFSSCFGISLLSLCFLIGIVGGILWLSYNDEVNAAQQVGKRLGINTDVETVKHYIYCDLIVMGTPITKVEANLSRIGSYQVYGKKVKKYNFDDPSIAYLLGEIHLFYGENWILLEKGKRAGFGDYEDFSCDP